MSAISPILTELVTALAPLQRALTEPGELADLLGRFGWFCDAEDLGAARAALAGIVVALDGLLEVAGTLPHDADPANILPACVELTQQVKAVLDALQGLASTDFSALAAPWNQRALWLDLATLAPETLLLDYFAQRVPALHMVLTLAGVVVEEHRAADRVVGRAAARFCRLRLETLGDWLAAPDEAMRRRFGWGTADADIEGMLRTLWLAFWPLLPRTQRRPLTAPDVGVQGLWSPDNAHLRRARSVDLMLLDGRVDDQTVVRLGVSVLPAPRTPKGRPEGLLFAAIAHGGLDQRFPLAPNWSLELAADAEARASVLVFPGDVKPGPAGVAGSFGVTLRGEPPKSWRLLGREEGGLFLDLAGVELELAVRSGTPPEVGIRMRTVAGADNPGVRLGVAPSEGDGFLGELLGSTKIEATLSAGLGWSSRTGFAVEGDGRLRIEVPVTKQVGPLILHRALIELSVGGERPLPRLVAALTVGAELGPFTATVENIGLSLALQPSGSPRSQVELGELGLGFGFRPPNGVGLAIDSETVKGGGFLLLDVDAGRYAGVLELVTPSFGLTALGILNTKIPGEPRGWALFFALTATFSPPIQLGFGFVLSGVGGLFAVNRRLDEPAMREAVRGGNLDSVLFPTDVVKEAPRIFATVESMFPIAKGSFVFGPMIKVGWGTPPLVEAMIGVFVSLPRPLIIALLGRVRCALPTPEKPVLILNMDVAGSINFAAGTVGLDAQIHDSSLFGLELTGAMAFRARFKDEPGFLLSVGGFHPAFVPPADVGKLTRMGMSLRLGKQENILVTLSSYFALTSNTLQFGAAIEVSASISVFKVRGGAYFDALIVYKPFHFTAGMGAYFSVSWREWDLLAVRVALVLDGPGPWRAQGVASFTIAGFEKSFEFDETFGDKIAASSERAPVAAPLRAALAEPRNWGAEPGGFTSLRLRDLSANDAGPIVVAPDARIGFRQRVAPLGLKLEQMGPAEPQEPGPFEVQVLAVAAQKPAALSKLTELFAPAAFLDLSDGEKLTAPSFEPMKAGVAFGDRWTAPEEKHRYTVAEDSDERYEQKGELWPKASPPAVEVVAFAQRVGRSGEAWKRKRTAVTVAPAGYVRVGGESVAEVDAPAVAWHEARAVRSAGERVVPVYAVKKVGR